MKGFPKLFKTREDLEVGMSFAKANPVSRGRMIKVLENIRDSVKVRRLKASVEKKMESLGEDEYYVPTDNDFEWVEIDNSLLVQMGLTKDEVDAMIEEVEGYGN